MVELARQHKHVQQSEHAPQNYHLQKGASQRLSHSTTAAQLPILSIALLMYSYSATSNQLLAVSDSVLAETTDHMGDFQDGNTVGNDYRYDTNGNLAMDLNKHIDSIRYNYLNLPEYIHIKGKGTISYVYDAGGTKYQKIVVDSTKGGVRDTTTYIGAFVYHSDTLQFMGHKEGRIRYVNKINQVSGTPFKGFVYDYFLKDHLGNTRMVLSEEQDTTIYVATMESKSATIENQLFNNVSSTQYPTPPGFEPSSGGDTSNHFVSRLNGNTSVSGNVRVGPSIVLKVMARDTVSANVYGWYQGAVQQPPSNETSLINDLLSTLSNDVIGQSGGHLAGGVSPVSNALSAVLPTFMGYKDAHDNTALPKAYLNWVLFDNQLNYVSGGVSQLGPIPGSTSKQFLPGNLPVMPKSGYLYIYLSNESQQDVFFDKLNIQFKRGPLLEETHYYPFGLTMAGISDKALKANYAENKYRYNKGSELQNKEFSDGSGLEMYETQLRELDPQLGRWWQVDSKTDDSHEDVSPYNAMNDDPARYNDPKGDEGATCCQTAVGVLQLTDQIQQSIVQFGGGPADPVTDAAATVVDAAGLVGSALGLAIDLHDAITSPAVAPAMKTVTYAPLSAQEKGELYRPLTLPKDVVKPIVKAHGNKLNDKPAEGYSLRSRKTGEVQKYGETTRGEDKHGTGNQKRYTKKELKDKDAYYQKEKSGTKKEMHTWQHEEILKHKNDNNGQRPPLNKSDY